jgi:hypothetical protein
MHYRTVPVGLAAINISSLRFYELHALFIFIHFSRWKADYSGDISYFRSQAM